MKKAILFWFYKEPKICLNRLERLKKYDPNLKIFWLFGGDKSEEKIYKNTLWKYLDSFYTLKSNDSHWKWIYWDLALQEWYENIWINLERDSIFVVQWDILIFDSLNNIFKDYRKDQIFLSWTRTLDNQIESKWSRTSSKKEKPKYVKFKEYLNKKYEYNEDLLCCLPMFEILPRKFFKEYWKLKYLDLWFIEYRKPTYAKILWFDFYKKNLGVRWFQENQESLPMNANAEERNKIFIKNELNKKDWRRMFHPYYKKRE